MYIGQSEPAFKDRYRNHTKAFRNKRYTNDTQLSKYIWKLQDKSHPWTISWSLIKRVNEKLNPDNCLLRLNEKKSIIGSLDNDNILNTRDEFVSK